MTTARARRPALRGGPASPRSPLRRCALLLAVVPLALLAAPVATVAQGPSGGGLEWCDPLLAAALRLGGATACDGAPSGTARGARRAGGAAAARFTSRADSLAGARARVAASRDARFRVIISLLDRRVAVMRGRDTLRSAPAAVVTGDTLVYDGQVWVFTTPRGRRTVLRKETDPYWTPPDWHYAEVARDNRLRLKRLPAGRPITLQDGSRLTIRDRMAGIIPPGSTTFLPLPTDEEIVFDETLFIPPFGTINRRIVGELGRYGLDLGGGYLLHGTPHEDSVGSAVTHGCVRLHDADIEWLYANVPVGTPVYVY